MDFKDYYKILGVDKGATKDDIKKAFRKLAHENHPDKNKGNPASEQKFKEASEAYSTLSDDSKRKQYLALRGAFDDSSPVLSKLSKSDASGSWQTLRQPESINAPQSCRVTCERCRWRASPSMPLSAPMPLTISARKDGAVPSLKLHAY